MIIEVGKRYVRRDGTVTPPLVGDWWDDEWACDPENSFVYGASGGELDHQVFHFREDPCDLISEYVE